jgi:hypothetical protein
MTWLKLRNDVGIDVGSKSSSRRLACLDNSLKLQASRLCYGF